MGSIRNEDYRKLSAFYANPDKYIETTEGAAGGRNSFKSYEWRDDTGIKKALKRFYETTGEEMDEGKGDLYFRGGLSLDGATGAGWAKGTNKFFEDFENYDHFNERFDEKMADRDEDEDEAPAAPEKEPEPYKPSQEIIDAKKRVNAYKKSKAGDFLKGTKEYDQLQGNPMTEGMGEKQPGKQTRDDLEEPMPTTPGTTNDTNNGFDLKLGINPDNPERRQLIFQ
nr:hypothetical protein 14 [Pelagibacteraceae bacterium]